MNKIYLCGGGGVGSWLAPAICLLVGQRFDKEKSGKVVIIDGDTLERGNLNRQLFKSSDIGKNKAAALAAIYGCEHIPQYYSHGLIDCDESDMFMCCVDNNPGRMAILESCDVYGCRAIFMSNETTSAEAYYYEPDWKDGPQDPRIYYPEIETDKRFDPRRIAIGCDGEAQTKNVQLVSANISAMSLGLQLYNLWSDWRKLYKNAVEHLPFRINQNSTKFEVRTIHNQQNQNI